MGVDLSMEWLNNSSISDWTAISGRVHKSAESVTRNSSGHIRLLQDSPKLEISPKRDVTAPSKEMPYGVYGALNGHSECDGCFTPMPRGKAHDEIHRMMLGAKAGVDALRSLRDLNQQLTAGQGGPMRKGGHAHHCRRVSQEQKLL
jgi:hypothetical protein